MRLSKAICVSLLLFGPLVAQAQERPPPERELKLLATTGLTRGERAEIYWLLDAEVAQLTFQVINPKNDTCVDSIDVTVRPHAGINVLQNEVILDENGMVRLDTGEETVQLDPCFDNTESWLLAYTMPISPRPGRDTAPVPRVLGGLVRSPGGEARAPINYGDFDGTTVMYVDVTETN